VTFAIGSMSLTNFSGSGSSKAIAQYGSSNGTRSGMSEMSSGAHATTLF